MNNKVVCLIPAYNEEKRIGSVIEVVKKCKLVDEIYVIDDGSEDKTAEVAKEKGAHVLKLYQNMGKSYAIFYGVENTQSDIVLMLDADLINLKVEDVQNLILPVLEDKADMTIGIFSEGRFSTDLAQKISPFLSGQRSIKRWVFDKILESRKDIKDLGYAIEIILTEYAKKLNLRVLTVELPHVSHVMKEEKLGFFKGAQHRMKMYREIIKGYVNLKKSRDEA
ncbi:glycosyltransferase family 2 protein [Caldicellulosiruptor changbaiensis]|uniref:Glucosyl-3-phosphoglycerate synthase n=1 Tax=Caldicellulosiruptor changbaiensis TaxID=1222016 RepID=A0A3T0D6Y3_9FIRM|nr:glycosyltransferase family 2 protein [Caldicellulosiruptor changbaiensis]AZT90808.1 glycosyltransferase family 2 protein [Caldicellulosiruptor changbaiensis]